MSEPSGELDIEIEQADRAELGEGPDPAEDESLKLIRLGRPAEDWRVFMTYACLKQMLAHTQRNLTSEIEGVFLGRIFRSNRGVVTVLTEAVPLKLYWRACLHVARWLCGHAVVEHGHR